MNTKDKIKRAIKKLKAGKAPGGDAILKADTKANIEVLYHLLNKVWDKIASIRMEMDLMVTNPKGGKLSECNNWRGIIILPIPSFLYNHS